MKKILLSVTTLLMLTSCEIHAVIDANEPLVVNEIISDGVYRVTYNHQGVNHYMVIKTDEKYVVSDTLKFDKK